MEHARVIVTTEDRKVLLKAKEAAEYLRISLFTLNRIERQGMLTPFRTPGGHRRYSLDMLNTYLEENRFPVRRYLHLGKGGENYDAKLGGLDDA